jgi:hypothetical protein
MNSVLCIINAPDALSRLRFVAAARTLRFIFLQALRLLQVVSARFHTQLSDSESGENSKVLFESIVGGNDCLCFDQTSAMKDASCN